MARGVESGILPDVEPGVPRGGTQSVILRESPEPSSPASNIRSPNPGAKMPPSTLGETPGGRNAKPPTTPTPSANISPD